MQQQMSSQDLEYGRTFPEPSVPQREKTSGPSSKRSAKLKTVTPLFLDLRKANGLTQERSWETGIPSHGGFLTLNFGAYPNVVEESFLWQILEANVPEKYSLSAKACEGILRRAERRGKELPSLLHFALLLKSGRLFTENVDADSSFYRRLCNFAEENECDAVIAYKPTPAIIASFMGGQGAKAGGIAYSEESAPSGSNTVPDVVYCIEWHCVDRKSSQNGQGWKADTSYTLNATDRHAICVFDVRGNGDGKICPTVTGDHENRVTDYTAVVLIPAEIILRRLTPTECARLQGMPDWWRDDIPHSDSAEYKMWGNGMALPCVLYVIEGIKEVLETANMGGTDPRKSLS